MSGLSEKELKVFVDSLQRYFTKTVHQEPQIISAFLGTNDFEGYEYNGKVAFSGSYLGQVIVSMPGALLRNLLVTINEQDLSENNLLDTVGEIANTLAGNARKKLGDELLISVPETSKGKNVVKAHFRVHPYVIILKWQRLPAVVCVDIDHKR